MADIHLVHIPSQASLKQQKLADPTRRRHSFAVNRLLAEPLREWYSAMTHLDPARLVWQHPDKGLAGLPEITAHPDRSDPALSMHSSTLSRVCPPDTAGLHEWRPPSQPHTRHSR